MRANFLLALTSTLFALFIGETALWVVGFHGEVEWTVSDIIRVEDAVLNYRLRPHSITSVGSVTYQLNKSGFRDGERMQQKEKGASRILVIGDSVAYGYKVKYEEIFSRRLEALLRERPASKKVEVITLAMPGLNTKQESALLVKEGSLYEPDLIILPFVLNDAEAGVSYQTRQESTCRIELLHLPMPCAFKNLLKKSALLYLVKEGLDHALWRFNVADADDVFGSIRADYFSSLYRAEEKWKTHVLEGFQKIAEFSKARQVPVVVVIFPVMFDFDDYRWGWIHEKIAQEGRRYQFSIVDLLGEYRKYPVKQTRIERGDFVHPNALGHNIAATTVSQFLHENSHLLPTANTEMVAQDGADGK
jgi:lysophospholipase L1-like esterase